MILVDHGAYLLQLSRYIQRNPINMKSPWVTQLPDYYWSSYPSYNGQAKPIEWLAQDFTFTMLGYEDEHKSKLKLKGYANYVMAWVDEENA